MKFHTDCRHFRGDRPCVFHKADGRPCQGCPDLDPIGSRILIIKLGAMGDVLRTTSILPALRLAHHGAWITWVTRGAAVDLLRGNPLIDQVVSYKGCAVPPVLLTQPFDLVLCLEADPEAASLASIVRSDEVLGFTANELGRAVPASDEARLWWELGLSDSAKQANRQTYTKILHDMCRLPPPFARPSLPEGFLREETMRAFKERWFPEGPKKVLGINTGAGHRWPAKKWTVEGYVELIKGIRKGHPGLGMILDGGPEEIDFNRAVLDGVGGAVIDAGCDNDLPDFASLLSLADVVFTPDSLGLHVAVALRKTVLAFVGPTSPWELDLHGKGEILIADEKCVACYHPTCPRDTSCTASLSPDHVRTVLETYL